MTKDFKIIIGLEIHAQLKTKSKMFCRCENNPEVVEPNTNICPICLGMPGTLPVANKKAIEQVVKLGIALNSEIATESKFDRKHYFYPDLPKGYQISQYDKPFCIGGHIDLKDPYNTRVSLNRIHLEEDAGKLVHLESSPYSAVDLNRAGTPLAEIVTEPDLTSPEMAKDFLKELQLILRTVGVSYADMEKGHLRCDANINVIKDEKSSPIIEIKNLNSFKYLEKALIYEQNRLIDNFDKFDGKKTKKTRGYNPSLGSTYSLREKEEAKDYRYFPEPDIPPIKVLDMFDIDKLSSEIEMLPEQKREIMEEAGVPDNLSKNIIKDDKLFKIVDKFKSKESPFIKELSKLLINEPSITRLDDSQIEDLINIILKENISSNIIRKVIKLSIENGTIPSEEYKSLREDSDLDVRNIVKSIIEDNQDAKAKYLDGKKQVLGFLVGKVMQETRGACDPREAQKIIVEELNNG